MVPKSNLWNEFMIRTDRDVSPVILVWVEHFLIMSLFFILTGSAGGDTYLYLFLTAEASPQIFPSSIIKIV